ncbi:hypothetical protein T484DRAFT_1852253 [Baffinella frigidus]|nr:hypothetical protein T484DRAFT_1852253 [Cryptophyta sp. CCMP2293]
MKVVNEYCKTLCKRKYTAQEMEEFQDFAILDYRVNMRLDSLPLAEEFQDFAILDYRMNMRLDSLPLAEEEMEEFQDFAILDYRDKPTEKMNTFTYEDKPTEKVLIYDLGYPLGGHLEVSSAAADAPKGADQYVLNNHLRFKILYHPFDSSDDDKFDRRDTDGNYIVGFQAFPCATL